MGLLRRAKKIRKKRWKKHLRKQKISVLKAYLKNFLSLLRKIILIIDISLLIVIFSFILSLVLVDQGIVDKDKYIEIIRYVVEFFR